MKTLIVVYAKGESVIFDVDVKGGVNIKKFYGERALSIFVQPPSAPDGKSTKG